MTNPSDLAGDEMRAPTAEEVKFYAWRGPGYWGPRDQVNTDMVMMAREVERLREAADTIDRLTSSGEAVGYVSHHGLLDLRCGFSASIVAPEAADEQFNRPLYTHASPREGHVEVPVEWTAPLDHDELLGITEYLMKLADIDDPEADETDCEDLCGKRECKAVGCIVSKFRRVRPALPHNQGETKP